MNDDFDAVFSPRTRVLLGDSASVNCAYSFLRWLGQLGLPGWTPKELEAERLKHESKMRDSQTKIKKELSVLSKNLNVYEVQLRGFVAKHARRTRDVTAEPVWDSEFNRQKYKGAFAFHQTQMEKNKSMQTFIRIMEDRLAVSEIGTLEDTIAECLIATNRAQLREGKANRNLDKLRDETAKSRERELVREEKRLSKQQKAEGKNAKLRVKSEKVAVEKRVQENRHKAARGQQEVRQSVLSNDAIDFMRSVLGTEEQQVEGDEGGGGGGDEDDSGKVTSTEEPHAVVAELVAPMVV
jgi:hypothetical protein